MKSLHPSKGKIFPFYELYLTLGRLSKTYPTGWRVRGEYEGRWYGNQYYRVGRTFENIRIFPRWKSSDDPTPPDDKTLSMEKAYLE
jgi:hypothetical protein